jgi:hypothetical protein
MRHVYLNGATWDRTQAHEHMRAFWAKNPKGFTAQMAALEREHKATKPGSGSGGEAPIEDVGTAKCMALIEKLLADNRKKAMENAEITRKPNAAEVGASLQRSLADALEREKRLQEKVKALEQNGSERDGG